MSGRRRTAASAGLGTALFDGPVAVLDAQAMSLLAEEDHHVGKRGLVALLTAYERAGYVAALSVITLAEERRSGTAAKRLEWWSSRLAKIEVTERLATSAGRLLEETGLDGHENVVDSIVVATAAGCTSEQARVISSDGSRIPALCKAATETREGRGTVEFKRVQGYR